MTINWDDLVSTDPKAAWCLTSVEIAKGLFNSEMIVVPRLDEAPYFDLMVCFTKKGSKTVTAIEKMSNLFTGDYDFQLRGHLTDLIDTEGSNLEKVHIACKDIVNADMDEKSLSQEWMSPDGKKAISIKFKGLSRKVINWASLSEGDLIFKIDLFGRKRMYIISEVVYASQTSISVKINGTQCEKKVTVDIPVAFSYAKFPIEKSGKLKQVIEESDMDLASTFAPTNF